jgi:hypothetical protein
MFSCKKHDFTYDKDEQLTLDTFSILLKSNILEKRDSSIKLQVEMLTLAGTNAFSDYNNAAFDFSQSGSILVVDSISFSVKKYTPNAYNVVLIFNSSNPSWLSKNKSSFYLNRYLNSPKRFANSEVAMYVTGVNSVYDYYKDGNSFYIQNNENALEWMYRRTIETNQQGIDNSDLNIFNTNMNSIIDSLNLYTPPGIDKEIILFQDLNWIEYNEATKPIIQNLIARLKLNNIRFSCISGEDVNEDWWILAQDGNGFISLQNDSYFDPQFGYDYNPNIQPEELCLANLDRLLTKDYETHLATFWCTNYQDSLNSGDRMIYDYYYGQSLFKLQHIIP